MICVRYWGGARDVAGRSDETVADGQLSDVLETLTAAHGPRMAKLLDVSVLLLDGTKVERHTGIAVPDGATLEVLPPSSGG